MLFNQAPYTSPSWPAKKVGKAAGGRWGFRKLPLEPRVFPTSGFETVDMSECIEEECISTYKPKVFYPVRLGEVFRNWVVAKFGFGSSATIRLGHDLQYVPLSGSTTGLRYSKGIMLHSSSFPAYWTLQGWS